MGILNKLRFPKPNVWRRTPASSSSQGSAAHSGPEESPTRAENFQETCSHTATCSSPGTCCTRESTYSPATSTYSVAFPVVLFVRDDKPDTPVEPAFVSLSSDFRIVVRGNRGPPSSLLDFRNPTICFRLSRMPSDGNGIDATCATLEELAAHRVTPVSHVCGPAICITENRQSIQLVAKNEDERNHWLSALCLRLAPKTVIRDRMKAEIWSEIPSLKSLISVVTAARDVIKLDNGTTKQTLTGVDGESVGLPPLAQRLWKTLGTTTQFLNWTSTLGQAIAGCADTVEQLAKPFCPIGVVGAAFSLISLSARAIHLLATEREGADKLKMAREDLKQASLAVCEWIVEILETGFQDEALISLAFDVIQSCWDAAADVEQYILKNWASRVWNADEIEVIERNVALVRKQLLSVGVLKNVAVLGKKLALLEMQSAAVDKFHSSFPDPVEYSAGLLPQATAITLKQLKSRVMRVIRTEWGRMTENNVNCNLRVALISLTGEGGVGKTSTCRLLCADPNVQKHFSDGAILWITLGFGVSDSQVIERISSIVAECGGDKTVEKVDNCESVEKAVNLARQFFSSYRILLVLDNVWKPAAEPKVGDWLSTLSRIVACPGSVVLMTTRFEDLSSSPGVDCVRLSRLNISGDTSPDWKVAEALYDQQLGMGPNNNPVMVQTDEYKRTRAQALRLSCGLPLAIATFCGLIQVRGSDARVVLSLIERRSVDGGLASRSFGRESAAAVRHAGLHAAMSQSLQFLDESEGDERMFKMSKPEGRDQQFSSSYSKFDNCPVSSRYAALEAMNNSAGTFSFAVLAHLWHMRCVDDAEDLCRKFANVGLGRIESCGPGGEYAFRLHDLQYDFCVALSSAESVNGHDLLLSGCIPFFKKIGKDWVPFCFPSERTHGQGPQVAMVPNALCSHMSQNLFRHMSRATAGDGNGVSSAVNDMVRLLTDFRWLRARGFSHGRAGVVSDFKATLSCFSTEQDRSGEVHQSICLIKRVLEQAPESSYRNLSSEGSRENEFVFDEGQLASHLVRKLDQALLGGERPDFDVKLIKELICSVEKNVRKAWIRFGIGFFANFSDDARLVMALSVGESDEAVTSVADFGDGIHIASGSCRGKVRVHNILTGATSNIVGDDESASLEVSCIAVEETYNANSYLVFHAIRDVIHVTNVAKTPRGRLAILDNAVVGKVISDGLSSFEPPPSVLDYADCSEATCEMMSVSPHGTKIVVGDNKGVVYVWIRCDENYKLRYKMAVPLDDAAAIGAISPGGDMVVFAHVPIAPNGAGGLLTLSDVRGERPQHRVNVNNPVRCLSVSPDGSFLFVGFSGCGILKDRCAVEIWNVLSKCLEFRFDVSALEVHCFSFIQQIMPLAEKDLGYQLLLGVDNSVQVYDLTRTTKFAKYLGKYMLTANPTAICTKTTMDGKLFIIAGCQGGFLTVFDASNNAMRRAYFQPEVAPERRLGHATTVTFALKRVPGRHEYGVLSVYCPKTGKFSRVLSSMSDTDASSIDASDDDFLTVSENQIESLRTPDLDVWGCKFVLQRHVRRDTNMNPNIGCLISECENVEERMGNAKGGEFNVELGISCVNRVTIAGNSNICFCVGVCGNFMGDVFGLVIDLQKKKIVIGPNLESVYPDAGRTLDESVKRMMEQLKLLASSGLDRNPQFHCETSWQVNEKRGVLEFRHSSLGSEQMAGSVEAQIKYYRDFRNIDESSDDSHNSHGNYELDSNQNSVDIPYDSDTDSRKRLPSFNIRNGCGLSGAGRPENSLLIENIHQY